MKWRLGVGGAALGLFVVVGILVVMFVAAPSMPGHSELAILLGLAGVLVVSGAVGGFWAGWLTELVSRKRQ